MKYLNVITTLIFVLVTGVATYAQDIIITVKAEKIEAKVLEIDTGVIIYKQYNNQDSPAHSIKKSDVASITYQNGQVIVFEQLQENSKDTINDNRATDYEYFKDLKDDAMADFLEANDPESYQIFHRGEILQKQKIKFIIAGGVISGIGLVSLGCWAVVWMGTVFYSIATFKPASDWWINNSHWFPKIGLFAIIAGQPFFIVSIALQSHGGMLKRQAKNNYEDKFFKSRTTMLNFNVYPNGLGVTFKF